MAPVGAALTRAGWASNSTGFSALQSTGTCSGPFTFSTVFETNSEVNRFDISLVSADLSQGVTVEGTTTGPKAGIWTGNSLSPPGAEGSYELDANPYNHVLYTVTISVDAAGNASVALADYRDGRVLGASPPIAVGTGPLYVVLGEGPGALFGGRRQLSPLPNRVRSRTTSAPTPGSRPIGPVARRHPKASSPRSPARLMPTLSLRHWISTSRQARSRGCSWGV